MTRAILLETSTNHAEVALAIDGQIIVHRYLSAARKHARDLAPTIHELLEEAGWSASSLALIAVDIGPGSYTGLRVGVVTVKALAYALDIPAIGVDAMTLLAAETPAGFDRASAIIDAQQGQVYAAEVRFEEATRATTFIQSTHVVPADEWAKTLTPDVYVTGPGLSRFSHLVPEGITSAPPGRFNPTASALATISMERFGRGQVDDAWTLEPLYLRPSSAQQKWDTRLAQQTDDKLR